MAKAVFNYSKLDNVIFSPLQKKLVRIGMKIQRDIKTSIKQGTGKIYMKGKNRDIEHQASSPGDPPAVDTGRLRASISTNWTNSGLTRGQIDPCDNPDAGPEDGIGNPRGQEIKSKSGGQFKVVVGTNVIYGPWLEFGTRRMAARPFIRPIFDRYKPMISRLMAEGELKRGE